MSITPALEGATLVPPSSLWLLLWTSLIPFFSATSEGNKSWDHEAMGGLNLRTSTPWRLAGSLHSRSCFPCGIPIRGQLQCPGLEQLHFFQKGVGGSRSSGLKRWATKISTIQYKYYQTHEGDLGLPSIMKNMSLYTCAEIWQRCDTFFCVLSLKEMAQNGLSLKLGLKCFLGTSTVSLRVLM